MSEPIHILSLGAGVQSSTMALMAAAGEFKPMPMAAIFADTGDEPSEVYEFLEWLTLNLPFPVHITQRSRLSDHLLEWGQSQIPAFMKGSIGKRQCTKHWKIIPIQQKIREITNTKRKKLKEKSIIVWHGISTDEVTRCKDSRVPWIEHRWPLIETRMSRRDCLNWMKMHGNPEPPKSACVYCPYRSPKQWKASKDKGGSEWELILKVSRQLEDRGEFLTSECLPIDQVNFLTEEERGQTDMFAGMCEGMCGV
jgi:hypothetical protein